MRTKSLFFTISLFFGLGFISVVMLFTLLIKMEYENYAIENIKRYKMALSFIDTALTFNTPIYVLKAQMKNLDLKLIKNRRFRDIEKISKFKTEPNMTIIKTKTKKIIELKSMYGKFYIEDLNKKIKLPINLYFSFVIYITVLSLIYFYIIKKLKPLRILRKKIRDFGEGNLNILIDIKGDDEIADVAKEFKKTIEKIKKLDNSRKLFLRNIMHELKTPLSKCRISAEMIEDGKNKERIISSADRLESLINDFAKIEEITSGNYHLDIQKYSFNEVIEYVFTILLIDEEKVIVEDNDLFLDIDFELFSIVVKNLIDNALKYSNDKKIKIAFKKDQILFISNGEKLEKNFSFYLKPFHNQPHTSHGMGLGLYIVNEILKIHGFSFSYHFTDNKNIFTLYSPHP